MMMMKEKMSMSNGQYDEMEKEKEEIIVTQLR